MLLRVADELESISDDVAALLKQFIRMRKANMKLSERGQTDLISLHDMCRTFAGTVFEAFRQGKVYAADLLNHMHSDASGITARVKEIGGRVEKIPGGLEMLPGMCYTVVIRQRKRSDRYDDPRVYGCAPGGKAA
jgi:hypothetical protein